MYWQLVPILSLWLPHEAKEKNSHLNSLIKHYTFTIWQSQTVFQAILIKTAAASDSIVSVPFHVKGQFGVPREIFAFYHTNAPNSITYHSCSAAKHSMPRADELSPKF
jgi:hypothetical protein